MILVLGATLLIAPLANERAVPCVSYLNANASAAGLASDGFNSILTEFDIKPCLGGRGIRIALTGWGQGTIDENPYPVESRFGNNEKYPGFQESRILEAPVKAEFAIWNGETWQRVTFGGNPSGLIPSGGHIWSDWGSVTVYRGQSIRARLRLEAPNPNFGRLLYSGGWGYDYRMNKTWAGNVAPSIVGPDFKANAFKYQNGNLLGPSMSALPAVIETKSADTFVRCLAAFGDSVLRASNDGGSFANPAGFHIPGWVGRGFEKLGIPVVSFGVSGDRSELNTLATMPRRLALLRDCGVDFALIQHGLNDAASTSAFSSARTPGSEILTRNQSLGEILKGVGIPKIYLSTVIPNTSSKDMWTTKGNQVTKKNGYSTANWLTYNRLITKSVPSGIVAVLNPAAYVGDENGIWYPGTRLGSRTALADSAGQSVTVSSYFVQDLLQGYYLNFALKSTSGPNSGKFILIDRSVGNGMKVDLSLHDPFPNPVKQGDTFDIYQVPTRDGNHPTTEGFRSAAHAVSDFPAIFK